MSDTFRLSHRAVAASALALLLSGAATAPALADGDGKKKDGKGGSEQQSGRGKGDKGDKGGSGQSAQGSQGGSQEAKGAPDGKGSQGSERGRSGTAPHGNGGQSQAARGGQGAQGGQATGQTSDPAGNNGTFKVDGLPFDDGLGNEPHVSCGFRLKFYGFDEGQTGDITIAGHAPSGSGVVSHRPDVLISDDAAGGGPNDPDAIVTYTLDDLDLSGLTPHPKQGYHVKVTLSTDTPGGVKHKVFWIEPCAPAGTVTPGTDDTGGTGGTGTGTDGTGDVDTGGVGVGGVGVGGTGTTVGNRTGTQVLGTRFTQGTDTSVAARGAQVLGTALARGPLAFTGSFTGALLALGGGLVGAGAGALALARRPRRRGAA